jgi:anaerobic ribonucleoside-triphosphate reductase activating protein
MDMLATTDPSRHPARPQQLVVGGFVPFSTLDWPGRFVAVVFVQGCPWRCGYCHNPHLQRRTAQFPGGWPRVVDMLEKRRGLLDGVVFSGGEPTADPCLAEAMTQVRALGYRVGLHTAGIYPRRLARVLPLADWVALDVKAGDADYAGLTGDPRAARKAAASRAAVLASGVALECRTTWHPGLFDTSGLLDLAQRLAREGVQEYALQEFRPQGCKEMTWLPHASTTKQVAQDCAALRSRIAQLFQRFHWRPARG